MLFPRVGRRSGRLGRRIAKRAGQSPRFPGLATKATTWAEVRVPPTGYVVVGIVGRRVRVFGSGRAISEVLLKASLILCSRSRFRKFSAIRFPTVVGIVGQTGRRVRVFGSGRAHARFARQPRAQTRTAPRGTFAAFPRLLLASLRSRANDVSVSVAFSRDLGLALSLRSRNLRAVRPGQLRMRRPSEIRHRIPRQQWAPYL